MLTVKNLHKKYDYKIVFKDVSFSLEKGQRAALVGPNGIGKSTLLKVIAGDIESDAGKIITHPGLRMRYVPQDMSASGKKTLVAYIRDVALFDVPAYQIETMLQGFGMADVSLDTVIADLSGGQKRKIALIAVLLTPLDILLLDEPTNDLDMSALVWLEDYLVRKKITAIIVSHDRVFLDNVTDRILAFNSKDRTISFTRGKYSNYLVDVKKREARERLEYTLQRVEIERLEGVVKDKQEAAKKGAKWQGTDNDKILRGFKRNRAAKSGRVAQVFVGRIERIDRLDKPAQKVSLTIPLDASKEKGVADMSLVDVVVGHEAFRTKATSIDIPYGTRIGFVGENGSGKSTLIGAITGLSTIISGEVKSGSGVRMGNLTQEHQDLPNKVTPLAFMRKQSELRTHDIYNLLRKFGIEESQTKQPIGILSSGIKTRLLLALFSAQSVNVLVLDEPTNHLDIEAVQALEELLDTYEGTVILVTHDRSLLEHAKLAVTYLLEKQKKGNIYEASIKKIKDYSEYVVKTEKIAQKLIRMV